MDVVTVESYLKLLLEFKFFFLRPPVLVVESLETALLVRVRLLAGAEIFLGEIS